MIDLTILCFIIVLFLITNINSAVFFWIIIVKKYDIFMLGICMETDQR